MFLGENDGSEIDIPMDAPPWDWNTPTAPVNEPQAGSSDVDWTGILGKAVEVWGNYENTQAQIEIAKIQATRPAAAPMPMMPSGSITYPANRVTSPYSPVYSPGVKQDDTLLYVGAAALVAVAIFMSR